MDKTVINFLKNNTNWNINLVSSIEKLGGLSSDNYKVIYNTNPYFVKLCTHTYLHTDIKNELDIITKASYIDIAPKLYYFGDSSGDMICQWINGTMPTLIDFKDSEFLSRLSKTLKKLHNLNCNKFFNPFNHIRERVNICRNLNLPLPESVDILLNKLNILEIKLKKNELLGLCHNDLNASNIILFQDNLYFVDYEYSSMGDIFFDLATISWFFNEDSRKAFLLEYFGYFSNEDYKKLLDYLFIVKFYNATWSLLKSTQSNSDYDYLTGAKMIFNDLLNDNSIRNF